MERILVVDDNPDIRDGLEDFFGGKGYEVQTAPDGKTAIGKLKALRPHIVLLDMMMPGMGGIDVLKEMKKVDPRVGVIMVTGVRDEMLARQSIKMGAYDYITKPMDLNYVESVVMGKIIDLLG